MADLDSIALKWRSFEVPRGIELGQHSNASDLFITAQTVEELAEIAAFLDEVRTVVMAAQESMRFNFRLPKDDSADGSTEESPDAVD